MAPSTFVGLLRGVNVGGKNCLPMAAFREALESRGIAPVKTYIQSGNVVGLSHLGIAELRSQIEAVLEEEFSISSWVEVFPEAVLAQALAEDPFESDLDPKTVHFFFLKEEANDPDLAKLEALAREDERYVLKGRVFYLWAPSGLGRSKLGARVEAGLGVPVTARNRRSAAKILELASTLSGSG